MTDGDIVERVGKMLPSLFPEEFKSKLESADKQTIKNLVMLHKNQNFQKVSEGGRTRSQKRTQKILRAVELAFETDIENAKPSFNRQLLDWNQNRGHFKRLDVSNLKVMSSDIDCPENKDENDANERSSKDTKEVTPMNVKSSISDSDDDESREKKISRRKRKARKPILVIKSEILSESSSDSTDIEDD